jgi:pimeloyl-ACP methyl ester carboxylesterase
MKATFVLAAALFVALAGFARASESDIALKTATGTIYGTLALADKLPSPVVLIIAGSGPTDRNGNGPSIKTDAYKQVAVALAKRGISSVRYDKRGIAASATSMQAESALRFDDYVNDAAAWVTMLSADSRFSRVVIAGHSEGSLIGMIAAQRSPATAFVSLEGAGRSAPTVLREQLKPKLPPSLYASADNILSQLQQGHTVTETPDVLASLFRPSVQPYLISWFKYDPAVEIAKLKIPAWVVQGSSDIQISMPDALALMKARPSALLIVVPDMSHPLKRVSDITNQQSAYTDPTLPVMPQVIDAIYNAAMSVR